MKRTLSRWQKWVQEASPSVAEILKQFPPLKISKVVKCCHNFLLLLNCNTIVQLKQESRILLNIDGTQPLLGN